MCAPFFFLFSFSLTFLSFFARFFISLQKEMSERPSQQQRGKPAGLSLSVPKEDSGEYRW